MPTKIGLPLFPPTMSSDGGRLEMRRPHVRMYASVKIDLHDKSSITAQGQIRTCVLLDISCRQTENGTIKRSFLFQIFELNFVPFLRNEQLPAVKLFEKKQKSYYCRKELLLPLTQK